ncbi:MAG: tetratricopeptide repeat protein [Omnitrophica bacterium]|nr:tetratricopeptide repeat protein [Candidatus Omnitrophota bacterium]
MNKNFLLDFFLRLTFRFYKLIIGIVFIVAFFVCYNIFLIDHTLEGLKYSLQQSVLAYDIEDVSGLDMLITKAIAKEIPPYGISSRNVIHLEFAKSIIEGGKSFKQLSHVKVALGSVIKEKEKERGFILTVIDKVNRPIREGLIYLAYIVRSAFGPKPEARPSLEVVDTKLFDKFRKLEKGKDLKELVTSYKEFIMSYPEYEKIFLAKLRLAYTYQRLGEYNMAIALYREITGAYPSEKDAKIAQIFLSALENRKALVEKANSLIIKSRALPLEKIDEKQKIFYEIGIIYNQLLNMKEAVKFFTRAVNLKPSSSAAIKAQYNVAWLAKQQNDWEKSLGAFSKIMGEGPAGGLIFDSIYQVAGIYQLQGKYDEFIKLSLKLAEDYRDSPGIASLCLFQAGASYLYDLNDPEKADEIFNLLIKRYPDTSYAKYLAPVSPVGLFVTYLVPRATRVVAWRVMGLLCLSGYTGEIYKFKAVSKEAGFNLGFNEWLKKELPDTVGNMYVDIRGQETDFKSKKAISQAKITMGQFSVQGKVEWALGVSKGNALDLIIKKAFLEKIPIPPILLNNSLTGIKRVIEKNFPVMITKASISGRAATVEGLGSKAALNRLKHDLDILFMTDFKIENIKSPRKRQEAYDLFNKKFPEGDFAVKPKRTKEHLFLDFFTRISLYSTFKILETVKDSRLDFERSIRTLGRLMIREDRFRVDLSEAGINKDMARFIRSEFPWLIDDEFLIDLKSLKLDFKDTGDVNFKGGITLGYGDSPQSLKPQDMAVEGTMVFDIDRESGIPRWVFKKISLDGRPFFLLDKLNMLTLRCLDMLKDENIPITMEEVRPHENGITFKGRGAGDFAARVLYSPRPFIIFQIRKGDLTMAGVKRIMSPGADKGALKFRGRTPEGLRQRDVKEKEKKRIQKQYIDSGK